MRSNTWLQWAWLGMVASSASCANEHTTGEPRTQSECAAGPLSEALASVIDVRTGVLEMVVRLNDRALPDFAGVGSLVFVERAGRTTITVPLGLAPLPVIEARLPIGEYDVWYQPEAQVLEGTGVPNIGGRIAERVVVDASRQRAQLSIHTRTYALRFDGIPAEASSFPWTLACGPTSSIVRPSRAAANVAAIVGASCDLMGSNQIIGEPAAPQSVRTNREPVRFGDARDVQATAVYHSLSVRLGDVLDAELRNNGARLSLEAHTPRGQIAGRPRSPASPLALWLPEGQYDIDLVYAFDAALGPAEARLSIARGVVLDRDLSLEDQRPYAQVAGDVRVTLPAGISPLRPAWVRAVYADAIVMIPTMASNNTLRFEGALPVGDAVFELIAPDSNVPGYSALAALGRRSVRLGPQRWQLDAALFEPRVWSVVDGAVRPGAAVIDTHTLRRSARSLPITMPLPRTLLSEGDYDVIGYVGAAEAVANLVAPKTTHIHIDSENAVGINFATRQLDVRFTLDGATLDPREGDSIRWSWPDVGTPYDRQAQLDHRPLRLIVDDRAAPTIELDINDCAGRERRDALCAAIRVHACAR